MAERTMLVVEATHYIQGHWSEKRLLRECLTEFERAFTVRTVYLTNWGACATTPGRLWAIPWRRRCSVDRSRVRRWDRGGIDAGLSLLRGQRGKLCCLRRTICRLQYARSASEGCSLSSLDRGRP